MSESAPSGSCDQPGRAPGTFSYSAGSSSYSPSASVSGSRLAGRSGLFPPGPPELVQSRVCPPLASSLGSIFTDRRSSSSFRNERLRLWESARVARSAAEKDCALCLTPSAAGARLFGGTLLLLGICRLKKVTQGRVNRQAVLSCGGAGSSLIGVLACGGAGGQTDGGRLFPRRGGLPGAGRRGVAAQLDLLGEAVRRRVALEVAVPVFLVLVHAALHAAACFVARGVGVREQHQGVGGVLVEGRGHAGRPLEARREGGLPGGRDGRPGLVVPRAGVTPVGRDAVARVRLQLLALVLRLIRGAALHAVLPHQGRLFGFAWVRHREGLAGGGGDPQVGVGRGGSAAFHLEGLRGRSIAGRDARGGGDAACNITGRRRGPLLLLVFRSLPRPRPLGPDERPSPGASCCSRVGTPGSSGFGGGGVAGGDEAADLGMEGLGATAGLVLLRVAREGGEMKGERRPGLGAMGGGEGLVVAGSLGLGANGGFFTPVQEEEGRGLQK
ncbi:hypothetical protein EYF80_047399 [Liparis tanakae]|uniref:Uncharacterized protein n=1 Tax=Liparis tanakae TaxID=230148 RepID=A0A4Z2FNK4_9TELE|nr:hypothetical protein EYF80_047399 [Liparis tanakae]